MLAQIVVALFLLGLAVALIAESCFGREDDGAAPGDKLRLVFCDACAAPGDELT